MFFTISHVHVGGLGDLASTGGFTIFGALLGAVLSVAFSAWIGHSGAVERFQQRRSGQKEKSSKVDPHPRGGSRLRARLARQSELALALWRWCEDLVVASLVAPWVVVFSFLLLVGLVALEPLVRSLGLSDEVAVAALLADAVLLTLAGSWIVTGVRTRKRTLGERMVQAVALVGLLVVVAALAIRTDSAACGAIFLGIATYFYVRLFP
jgi:hypothetical protein